MGTIRVTTILYSGGYYQAEGRTSQCLGTVLPGHGPVGFVGCNCAAYEPTHPAYAMWQGKHASLEAECREGATVEAVDARIESRPVNAWRDCPQCPDPEYRHEANTHDTAVRLAASA